MSSECVDRNTVVPPCRLPAKQVLQQPDRFGSRPTVGSSTISTFGSCSSADGEHGRCRMPWE